MGFKADSPTLEGGLREGIGRWVGASRCWVSRGIRELGVVAKPEVPSLIVTSLRIFVQTRVYEYEKRANVLSTARQLSCR